MHRQLMLALWAIAYGKGLTILLLFVMADLCYGSQKPLLQMMSGYSQNIFVHDKKKQTKLSGAKIRYC